MLFGSKSPIAVIDSGLGGLKLCKKLRNEYSEENIIYFADDDFMPYGNKSYIQLKRRLETIIKFLIETFDIKMVVLACNTISATYLQSKIRYDIPVFVVSPAGFNATIICTKMTAKLYKYLDCIELPKLASKVEEYFFDCNKLKKYLKQIGEKHNFNAHSRLVLGCTHYELVAEYFKEIFPQIEFLSPIDKTFNEIKNSNFLSNNNPKIKGETYIICSSENRSYIKKLQLVYDKYL